MFLILYTTARALVNLVSGYLNEDFFSSPFFFVEGDEGIKIKSEQEIRKETSVGSLLSSLYKTR